MSTSHAAFADDRLGLEPFSEKLERYLITEHDFVTGSLVVSLCAPFGSGKTTFLSMWQSKMNERREQPDQMTPRAIMINAWESDYCGDPLLAITTALVEAVEGDSKAKPNAGHRLREAAKDVAWFTVGLANSVSSTLTGLDVVKASQLAEDKKKERKAEKPDFVALYENRKSALNTLKEVLRDIFGGLHPKAFIFVDELDRCRPDYAISYLETIKHIFDVRGLVFLLAVDYRHLENSARALFGINLAFNEYFRKFVHRSFQFPQPDETVLKELAKHYAQLYLEAGGKRISLMGPDVVGNTLDLIVALEMNPRQMQEVYRMIGHAVSGDQERAGRLFRCYGAAVIFMCSLKVMRPAEYAAIGLGKFSHLDVGRFLRGLLPPARAYWWFRTYLTGSGEQLGEANPQAGQILKDLGFVDKESSVNLDQELGVFLSGWSGMGDWGFKKFHQIYQNIESAQLL